MDLSAPRCRRRETRRSLLGSFLLLGLSLTGSLLLLDVLGDELLVLGGGLLAGLEAVEFLSLDDLLAAEALLGDEALDLGGLVVSLVTALDLTADNVLGHIVLLGVEAEDSSDSVLSLLEETVGLLISGEAINVLVALLGDLEGNDSEVGSGVAAAD